MRWGLFQTAEYINMIVLSALCVTLFFGGWQFPWVDVARPLRADLVPAQARRRSSPRSSGCARRQPRLRYDQLMRFGWKVLLPVATAQRARHRPLRGAGSDDERARPQHAQGLRRHAEAGLQEADHAAVPGVQAARSTRASAAGTACTCTRTGSRSASAARSAPPRARPTASASSPPRTRPTTASRPASATRASTRST